MSDIDTTKVWLANFTTSAEATKQGKELFNWLGFSAHYQIARLAIGRSLGEPNFPETAPDAKGITIKGNLLFGDEQQGALLWVGLLVENINQHSPNKTINLEVLQHAVRDHWRRGISLLQQDWDIAGDYNKFVELLITRRASLPNEGDYLTTNDKKKSQHDKLSSGAVALNLGQDKDSGEVINWVINGQGYSPNVAIMGQSGSGKTRMMLKLLTELRELTGVPVLLIDVQKDELAERYGLANALGAKFLKIPSQPIPLDIFAGSTASADAARDVTIAFRESLDKALAKGLTDNQKMNVLEALKPLFAKRKNITMLAIQQAIERHYEDDNKSNKPDRVIAIIHELCQYTLFEPTLSPAEFFSQSWILTFGGAPTESRRLAIFLLFDALHRYLQTLPESPMDENNHRAVRMAVAVDEARPLLDAKHDGLSKMVRLHRSHGLTVFMASQSPDDYAGQSDDYMEQIGLPICFKTNATSTAVLNNMFKAKPNFASLESGTCLTVIENSTRKVRAF